MKKLSLILSLFFFSTLGMSSSELNLDDIRDSLRATISELQMSDLEDRLEIAHKISSQVELFDQSKIGISFKSRKYSRVVKKSRSSKLLNLKIIAEELRKMSEPVDREVLIDFKYRAVLILESLLDS